MDGYEISVIYFRAAYAPSDFTSEADWEVQPPYVLN